MYRNHTPITMSDSFAYTQSAEEDMEVVQLREQNAKLKEERDSMVRMAVDSFTGNNELGNN